MQIEKSNLNDDCIKDKTVGASLLDFLLVLSKYRNFLIVFISISIILSILIGLLIPKTYKATASVLPAEKSDLLSSLGGISSIAKSFSPLKSLGSLSGDSEIDKYIAILNSKQVANNLITKFDLRKVYEMEEDPKWKLYRELEGNLDFEITDEGNLDISVYDESPELSANMANHLVELLNTINTNLHVLNAKSSREFIERRYFQNLRDIDSLENQMMNFQKENGVIAVPEQLEATIQSLSKLYVELTRAEVEVNVLKRTQSEGNPLINQKEIEVQEIEKKINRLNAIGNSAKSKVILPLNQGPELINEYLKIYKNLEIQYTIAEFITPIYEQAKIEEVRNTPSVLVLDKAYPPERKAKPKIALIVILGFIISMIISLFIIFTRELLLKLETIDPEKFKKVKKSFMFR